MLEERGKDWGDKVRLIGLSIDKATAIVKNHVEDKKWTSVEHYHVRTPGCTADKDYGVQGVPHVLLVDTQGKIVFVGHPASRQLEQDIDSLLKGQTLTGEGTGAEPKEEEGSPESTEESISANEAEAALEKFKKESKAWNELHKETLKALARAFLVLEQEATFDCTDKQIKYKLDCHLVLVGPAEIVEAIEKASEDVCKGPWKMHKQIRAI